MLDSGLTMWLCYRLLWSLISLLPYIIHVTNNLMLNNNFFLGWKVGNVPSVFLNLLKTQTVHNFCVVAANHLRAYGLLIDNYCYSIKGKKAKAHTSQRPKWLELILVCLAWSMPRIIATSPGWDASPPPPLPVCHRYPFVRLCIERKYGVKFLVWWNKAMGEAWTLDLRIWTLRPLGHAYMPPHCYSFLFIKILN